MKLTTMQVVNFKSFADSGLVSLDQINVLIGRNNAGKSAIIQAAHLFQQGAPHKASDIRLGAPELTVSYSLSEVGRVLRSRIPSTAGTTLEALVTRRRNGTIEYRVGATNPTNAPFATAAEPDNFIYTYLSKRKVTNFDQVVDRARTNAVSSTLQNLVSKVARLANLDHPNSNEYAVLCNKVLGFRISTYASEGGQQAGISVDKFDYIPIEDMGEGVSSLLGLITDLCMADGNLFLIEELENDIHPGGLKAILDIIVEKSANNQFIVSTHSNIVAKYLGSAEHAKIFSVEMIHQPGKVPTSTIHELAQSPKARIEVLQQLGYELYDFDLWEGWLILEESSAEVFIRNYLIPWFAPKLSRIRTVSAGGGSRVRPTFEDFRRVFLFTHLEDRYKNRAWVVADGDQEGKKILTRLRGVYGSWPKDHFRNWTQEDFESYYPERFAGRTAEVLAMSHDDKRAGKTALLEEVKEWCEQQPVEAKSGFEVSAGEVVDLLREIEKALFPVVE